MACHHCHEPFQTSHLLWLFLASGYPATNPWLKCSDKISQAGALFPGCSATSWMRQPHQGASMQASKSTGRGSQLAKEWIKWIKIDKTWFNKKQTWQICSIFQFGLAMFCQVTPSWHPRVLHVLRRHRHEALWWHPRFAPQNLRTHNPSRAEVWIGTKAGNSLGKNRKNGRSHLKKNGNAQFPHTSNLLNSVGNETRPCRSSPVAAMIKSIV